MLYEPGTIFYRRSEIHELYGGQRQAGISTPSKLPYIFLFTGETGAAYGYRDEFKEDGTFWYTGEGQAGDMEMVRGNKAIRDHKLNGLELHLFESLSDRRIRYIGEAEYLSHHMEERPDVEGNSRQAIVFELVVESIARDTEPLDVSQELQIDRSQNLWSRSMDALQDLAKQKQTPNISVQERRRTVRVRSEAVKVYVQRRANGICEACHQVAPFNTKKGRPYLEPHHVHRISDGGPDHPLHVAALCPNCHRRVHHGKDGSEYNMVIIDKIQKIEAH